MSRKAARQEFLNRWYRAVAMGPFVVALIVVRVLFSNSHPSIQFVLLSVAMVWAGAVIGYAIFLRFAVRCPVCGGRFGGREKCSSCGLPRHRQTGAYGVAEIGR